MAPSNPTLTPVPTFIPTPPLFDGTLRTATTTQQTLLAERKIQEIQTLAGFCQAVGPGAERLTQPPHPSAQRRLCTSLVQSYEHVVQDEENWIQAQEQAETAIKAQQELLQAITAYLHLVQEKKEQLETDFLLVAPQARDAIRESDASFKAFDNQYRQSQASNSAPTPSSSRPPTETPARHDIRNLTSEEQRRRTGTTCDRCRQKDHWACDHLTYRCHSCGKLGPGHGSKSSWCPKYTRPNARPIQYPQGTAIVAPTTAPVYVVDSEEEDGDWF